MKLSIAFFFVTFSLLGGCSTGSLRAGTVFHTADGQTYIARSLPVFDDGQYKFLDSKGSTQSLNLSQVTSVSER